MAQAMRALLNTTKGQLIVVAIGLFISAIGIFMLKAVSLEPMLTLRGAGSFFLAFLGLMILMLGMLWGHNEDKSESLTVRLKSALPPFLGALGCGGLLLSSGGSFEFLLIAFLFVGVCVASALPRVVVPMLLSKLSR